MGADIHDWAEIRRNGRWKAVGEVFVNPYHRPEEYKPDPQHPGEEWDRPKTMHPLRKQSYLAFTILAGVRKRDDAIPCISQNRGYPPDVTDGCNQLREEYGGDGHNPGWVTLRELITYQWRAVDDWADRTYKYDKRKPGESWTWLQTHTVPQLFALITTNPEAVAIFQDAMKGDTLSVKALDDWLEEHSLPTLDDVRMVFFFDN